MLRTTVLERGRLIRADTDAQYEATGTPDRRVLPQRFYDRLFSHEGRREDRGEQPVFVWRRNTCQVGPWVGVLQVPGLQLEILPKLDGDHEPRSVEADAEAKQVAFIRNNLMEMLLRAGLGAVRARGLADLAVRRGNLHDQLVDAFLNRCLDELRRGLDRGYQSDEGNLLSLRGRLMLSRQLTVNAARKTHFYCRHDVLTEATRINVRLRQACRLLASRPLPASVMVKCQQVLAILDDVPDVAYTHREPDPVFNRQNERFADVWDFATLLLEGQAPDARRGEVATFSLLFNMEQVFERYIAAIFTADVVPQLPGLKLLAQGKGDRRALFRRVDEGDEDKPGAVLQLKPDLVFEYTHNGHTSRFIVDTKWKRLGTTGPARPSNGDLYQLYAYLHRYDCEVAAFLYPNEPGARSQQLTALGRPSRNEEHAGTVRVEFANLNRDLRAERTNLADELLAMIGRGLQGVREAQDGVSIGATP